MNQITDFFSKIFDVSSWPARWYCGEWTEFHGWLYIISDLMIWSAYFAIPALIFYFITKSKVPFKTIFWLFIAFILLCGLTHLMDAIIFYWPAYRLSAFIRLLTGIVSWVTVVALFKIIPIAFSLKTPEELEQKNKALEMALTELEAKSKDLSGLTAQLIVQNKQLEDFTHITSHNLRAPVGNIISLIEIYKEEKEQKEKERMIALMENASLSLINTLNQINDIIKIKKEINLDKVENNFETVLKTVKNQLNYEISKSNILIHSDFRGAPTLYYPQQYLESIFWNLISNSIKFRSNERSPELWIKSYADKNFVYLSFKDNGQGMDTDVHSGKIFGLYKTFHNNPESRGVGLFITKTQVEAMGGNIDAKGVPEVGMEIKIKFIQ